MIKLVKLLRVVVKVQMMKINLKAKYQNQKKRNWIGNKLMKILKKTRKNLDLMNNHPVKAKVILVKVKSMISILICSRVTSNKVKIIRLIRLYNY